jgi:PAS domain S-box-containing protein
MNPQATDIRYRELFSNMGNAVVVYETRNSGEDFVIRDINRAASRIEKVRPDDVIGRSVLEVFPGVREFGIFEVFQRVWRTGQPEHFPVGLYEDERITGWRENYIYKLPSGEVVAVYDDMTERRQAEQTLQQSEQHYRTLAQNIPAIVYRVYLRNRNRTEFFNDMLREMTGYREDELRRGEACSIDPLILPEDFASVVETVKRATSESRPFQIDYRITHQDGSIRHFSEQGRPVSGADGRPEYIDGVIFDATEARRSEQIVRQSEERLAEAQRIAHVGSWLWDIRGRQSFWSAELYRILGLALDSVPPTEASFLARVHPDDRAHFEARVAEAMRNQRSYDFDLRVVRPDGVERFAHGETKVEYDAAGEPALLTGICQDVTERKQAEMALRVVQQRREQLENIVDCSPAVAFLWRTDPQLTVDFVSANVSQFGYEVGEFLSGRLHYIDIIHPEDWGSEGPKVAQYVVAGAVEFVQEYRIFTKAGEVRWVEDHTWVPRDPDGSVSHHQGIIVDVTARRQAERALRESEERFRQTAENVPDGLLVVDGRQVSFVNRRLEEILGFSREEIRQMGVLGPIAPEDRQRVIQELTGNVQRGVDSFGLEFRIVRKDGTRRCVQCRYALGAEPGQTPRHYIIMTDVTERKRVEDALRENEERYRNLFTNAPIGMYRTRPDGTVLVVNPALVRMMQYGSAAELMRCNLEREGFSPRFDRAQFKARLDRDGELLGLEAEWVRADGSPLLVRENARVVRDAQGQVLYYEGTIEDVTERKRAEQALRREKEQAQEYLDVAGNMFVVLDAQGKIIRVNQSACDVLGWAEQDLVGKNWFDTCLPERVRSQVGETHRRLQSDAIEDVEYVENPVLTRAGAERLIAWHNTTLKDTQGNIEATLSSGEDITERKAAEEKLRRYSEDLALLNRLDAAINRGENLDSTIALLAAGTRKSFGGRGATLFLLSEDRQYLELANMGLSEKETEKVEQVLGVGLPRVRVALKPGGFHTILLETGQARILSDAQEIEHWAGEMTESPGIRKLVPTLRRLLGLDSIMLVPLAISGRPIGLLVASRHELFSESDLKRFSAIAEQMAVVIGRKLADDALKANEEKYRLVVEHANEAILVVRDGLLKFTNLKTVELLGYSPEEIHDRPFPQFIHPDDRAMVVDRHQKRLRGEPIPERYVFRIVRKDGTTRSVEIGATVTTWQGQPATLSFLTDVTERELAAEREAQQRRNQAFLAETAVGFVRLGEQENVYQHICSRLHMLIGDAYVVVNSYDPKTSEFQVRAVAGFGNRLDDVRKLMGRKLEGTVVTLPPKRQQELVSDRLKQIEGGLAGLSFGQLPKSLTSALEKTFNVGEVYAMALFHQGAILGTVNILLRGRAVLPNPEVVETFVSQAAVALQRRLAEDELRRHQHHLEELVEERTKELKQAQNALVLQERLAAIGKVAGSMAHEIRNPLAAMRNAVYFLTNSLGPKLDGKEARHLEIVNQEIDVANGIITSVLDFARGRPAELVPLNLADVLVIAQERAVLPADVQVRRNIPFDLPMVRIDLQQTVQVFINLLTNASQAMDGKGRITVSAHVRDGKVRVNFKDEGPGIAPENLKRVFEPLFSTKTVGIGMGLTVCKAFVESCNGTIEVESEPGKGATFTITLRAVSSE